MIEFDKKNRNDSLKKEENNTIPIQFYIDKEMKRRLKMYCASTDKKMTSVLIDILDDFLLSQGF